jgi:hypothetical protein
MSSAPQEVVIGGRVAEANLIRKVEPVYPVAARASEYKESSALPRTSAPMEPSADWNW